MELSKCIETMEGSIESVKSIISMYETNERIELRRETLEERMSNKVKDLTRSKSCVKDKLELEEELMCVERKIKKVSKQKRISARLNEAEETLIILSGKLQRAKESDKSKMMLLKVDAKIKEKTTEVLEKKEEYGRAKYQLCVARESYEDALEYERQYPPALEKYRTYKLYYDTLTSKSGLQNAIIGKKLEMLITICNGLLTNIADFKIKYEYTERGIVLLINDVLPIELASGYQKFTSKLVFRLALSYLMPSAAEFIVIDEGFGCLDRDNLRRIRELFEVIHSKYKFVFIISHLDELQNIIKNRIVINRNIDGVSVISNDTFRSITKIREELRLDPSYEDRGEKIYCKKCKVTINKTSKNGHERSKRHNL